MEVRCYDSYGNTINHLTQWDINQTVSIDWTLDNAPSFHFCNIDSEYAIVVESEIKNGKAISKIPNILLQSPNTIAVFVYLEDGDVDKVNGTEISVANISGRTVCTFQIPVRKKPQPQDYEFVENIEYASWVKLEQDLKEYVDSQLISYNARLNELAAWIFSSTGMIKKNLLENTMTGKTFDGVITTVNDDKSVSVSFAEDEIVGEQTALRAFEINTIELESGEYIISGCPLGGGADSYNLQIIDVENNSIVARDTGNGDVFFADANKKYKVQLCVSLKDTSKELVFYPMVRCSVVSDDTYEQYTHSLQKQIENIAFNANNQEVIDARAGSLIDRTFSNLTERLSADFDLCITQGELEKALSSVTTAYTTADNAIRKQVEQVAGRDYVGRFWRDEAGSICGEVFNDYKNNVASGDLSAANGSGTISTGEASMTWGKSVEATETCATAWGFWTKASKQNSTAWGASTVADAKGATACGYLTIATCEYSFVLGRANVEDTEEKYVVIVGNGNNSTSRSNALTLDWNGVLWVSGDITVTGSDNKTVSLMQTNQEIDDAHTGSIVKNTFSSLVARLNADFDACITQGELERALSSVTNAYTTADNVQNALLLTAMGLTKGSKNLLKNTTSSTTKNGLTFTVNDDGSITVNGTATADTEITLRNMTLLANTDYILSGCPSGGTGNSYRMYAINTSTWAIAGADYGSSYTLSTGNNTGWSFRIQIKSGYTANDLAFYPMLRYAEIADDTYEPYVPSLQEQINDLRAAIAAMNNTTTTVVSETE